MKLSELLLAKRDLSASDCIGNEKIKDTAMKLNPKTKKSWIGAFTKGFANNVTYNGKIC
jgi:hypothetical protein